MEVPAAGAGAGLRIGEAVVDETWTTDEYGSSHEGHVGVLLEDGSVPEPVYFDSGSGSGGQTVSYWSVYDGRRPRRPRAAVLRAVCSCGWTGPEHPLDWRTIGEQPLREAGLDEADACEDDWDEHTVQVEATTVPLPAGVTELLGQLEQEIEKLAKSSPVAAVKAARRLEITAIRIAHWPAHDTRHDLTAEQAGAALGLSPAAARSLLARYGGWSPYH
ncbi:hypothetical protein ACFWBI_04675 [Streptomyces sp. NPDC059982]|uniref:hypothetical protein n=1 Tax=unclassified Streptomyces TaxID=2593676 RepID=UPI00369AD4CD